MYNLAHRLLKKFNPEFSHNLSIKALKLGFYPKLIDKSDDTLLEQSIWGRRFKNPIGLSAGFDKNAEVIEQILNLGFGFTEVGTVTPLPQIGNPKPRIFRLNEHQAIANSLGFNNLGMEVFEKNINQFNIQSSLPNKIVGINIGNNKDTNDILDDLKILFDRLHRLSDYIVVNLSSPNTPGLRDNLKSENFNRIVTNLLKFREKNHSKVPILFKISPDISDQDKKDIALIALANDVDGLILTNTTIQKSFLNYEIKGGISGKPLFEKSNDLIRDFKRKYEKYKKLPDVTPELAKKFYYQGIKNIYQIELENKLSDKSIKNTKKIIKQSFLSFENTGLLKLLNDDCSKILEYYRNEVNSGRRKTDIFQNLIIRDVLHINKLLYFRISNFSDVILKTYNKNPYASLILLRSNVENLVLYYFYNNEIERLFNKDKWLDIVKLNSRLLYSKQHEVKTNTEIIYQSDHQDMINLLVTMHGAKEKPIHISECINYLLKCENQKNLKLEDFFNTPILKEYSIKSNFLEFYTTCPFDKQFYDQLCEIVHPVAIEMNKYPFDKDDPNVKIKFSTSYMCLAYASTLFIQGINIYEKLRAFEYRKINIIEKNLSSAIYKLRVESDLEFISKNLTSNTISEEERDFLKNVQTRYNKEKN